MNIAYLNSPENLSFSSAQEQLELMIKYLDSSSIEGCDHGEIEQYINEEVHLNKKMMHGGSTYGNFANRSQLRDCTSVLEQIIPVVIDLMMDGKN